MAISIGLGRKQFRDQATPPFLGVARRFQILKIGSRFDEVYLADVKRAIRDNDGNRMLQSIPSLDSRADMMLDAILDIPQALSGLVIIAQDQLPAALSAGDAEAAEAEVNLRFLNTINAVVIGVLLLQMPNSIITQGLRRNYRFLLQLIVLILFWELYVIQDTYHRSFHLLYTRPALGYDLILLALPFVLLSRLIAESKKRDALYASALLLFAFTVFCLAIRQIYFLFDLHAKGTNPLEAALFIPVAFDVLGAILCLVAHATAGGNGPHTEKRRLAFSQLALFVLVFYFLLTRMLHASSQMYIDAYKSSLAVTTFIFAYYISDFSDKKPTVLIVHKLFYRSVQTVYIIPTLWLVYNIYNTDKVAWVEWCILFLAVAGVVIVAKAKYDLDNQHAWAGKCSTDPELVVTGIYSWIRHPIYLGISLFALAGVLQFLTSPHQREAWESMMTGFCIALIVFVGVYIAYVANLEETYLAKNFNQSWHEYKNRVGAVFPRLGRREA